MQFGIVTHIFHDPSAILTELGFDFPDAMIVSCELERDIAIVERTGGQQLVGMDLPEIVWFIENLDAVRVVFDRELQNDQQSIEEPSWEYKRVTALLNTDWVVQRHMEQQFSGVTTDLTEDQYRELLQYRQGLRDLPHDTQLPSPPQFL
jgi:hypothetical protein